MTKIFPVQTAQPDSLLARPGPAAALAPAPHLPAAPPSPPPRPVRGCPGPAAAPSRRGARRSRAEPCRCLPAVRGLGGAAGPRLMAVREGRATPIQPRLSASRGQTPTNPPRATNSAGRACGPPGGHPSRAAEPSPLPQDGSREQRAERGVRGARRARSGRYWSGSRTKKTMCGGSGGGRGQRRHLRVRGGAAAAPPPSLPPRLQRRRLRVPSFGRLFGFSSAVCWGVWVVVVGGGDCFCFG